MMFKEVGGEGGKGGCKMKKGAAPHHNISAQKRKTLKEIVKHYLGGGSIVCKFSLFMGVLRT